MEKGEHLKRQSRPSLLQLRYLKELQTMKKTRGVQRVIAERCEVNASTISEPVSKEDFCLNPLNLQKKAKNGWDGIGISMKN